MRRSLDAQRGRVIQSRDIGGDPPLGPINIDWSHNLKGYFRNVELVIHWDHVCCVTSFDCKAVTWYTIDGFAFRIKISETIRSSDSGIFIKLVGGPLVDISQIGITTSAKAHELDLGSRTTSAITTWYINVAPRRRIMS